MPLLLQAGCCCSGTKICLNTICGVSVPVPGAIVQILTGTTLIDQYTTGSDGCCNVAESGTYNVKILYNGVQCQNVSRALSGSTININLSGCSSQLLCCGNGFIPQTLTLTDFSGSGPFTYMTSMPFVSYAGGPAPGWYSCRTFTASSAVLQECLCNAGGATGEVSIGSGPVALYYYGFCADTFTTSPQWPTKNFVVYLFLQCDKYDPNFVVTDPCGAGQPCAGTAYGTSGVPVHPTVNVFKSTSLDNCTSIAGGQGLGALQSSGQWAAAALPTSLSPFVWSGTLAYNGGTPLCPSPPGLGLSVSS